MRFWPARINRKSHRKLILSLMACALLTPNAVMAQDSSVSAVEYRQDGAIAKQVRMPIYSWQSKSAAPRGVVLAIHGLVMHGKSYDRMARTLAAQGFVVYATDLRGYGRCGSEHHHEFCELPDCKQKIDYEKSFGDLVKLSHALKEQYPSVPFYCIGESLGGAMAIKMSSKYPELINGLILSAPAIKRHNFFDPYLMAQAASWIAVNPKAQLDLMPFVRKFASDDPDVINEMQNDPLLRTHLSAYELLKSHNAVRKTISYVPGIKPEIPVLVIQGSADRCIKANAVMLLLSRLRSVDQTVKWFHQRGHILLETSHVKPDTMDSVVMWLSDHANEHELQVQENHHDHTSASIHPQFHQRSVFNVNGRAIYRPVSGQTDE
jgi:acylglycerol lipase